MIEKDNVWYVPDYNNGIIHEFSRSVPRTEIWEYFETFDEAKFQLIQYFDNLLNDTKNKLNQAKKLKSPNTRNLGQIDILEERKRWKRYFKYHHKKKYYSSSEPFANHTRIQIQYTSVWLYIDSKSEYNLIEMYNDNEHLYEIYNVLSKFTKKEFKEMDFFHMKKPMYL